MDFYKKFVFVKDFNKSETEKIPSGSELLVLNDKIYFNGGMITPANYFLFNSLIEKEMEHPNYLREVPIPYNKV